MQSLALANQIRPVLKRLFYKDSVFIAIKGMAETGKTNLVFLLMELTWELGMFTHYCGNVPIQGNAFPYQVIRDLQTLKLYCRALPKGSRIFFFFDEVGKNAPKITPWAKLNVSLLTSLQVLRKYHLTLVVAFIGDSVSNQIISPTFVSAWIEKVSKTYAVIHDYHRKRISRLRNIPKSSIGYDEFADVSFSDRPTEITDALLKTEIGQIALREQEHQRGTSLRALNWHREQHERDMGKLVHYIIENLGVTSSQRASEVKPEETSDETSFNT